MHGDVMATILLSRAQLYETLGESSTHICALARRALASTFDPDLKQPIQELIDQLCANPPT
jgi:hypothetical protein